MQTYRYILFIRLNFIFSIHSTSSNNSKKQTAFLEGTNERCSVIEKKTPNTRQFDGFLGLNDIEHNAVLEVNKEKSLVQSNFAETRLKCSDEIQYKNKPGLTKELVELISSISHFNVNNYFADDLYIVLLNGSEEDAYNFLFGNMRDFERRIEASAEIVRKKAINTSDDLENNVETNKEYILCHDDCQDESKKFSRCTKADGYLTNIEEGCDMIIHGENKINETEIHSKMVNQPQHMFQEIEVEADKSRKIISVKNDKTFIEEKDLSTEHPIIHEKPCCDHNVESDSFKNDFNSYVSRKLDYDEDPSRKNSNRDNFSKEMIHNVFPDLPVLKQNKSLENLQNLDLTGISLDKNSNKRSACIVLKRSKDNSDSNVFNFSKDDIIEYEKSKKDWNYPVYNQMNGDEGLSSFINDKCSSISDDASNTKKSYRELVYPIHKQIKSEDGLDSINLNSYSIISDDVIESKHSNKDGGFRGSKQFTMEEDSETFSIGNFSNISDDFVEEELDSPSFDSYSNISDDVFENENIDSKKNLAAFNEEKAFKEDIDLKDGLFPTKLQTRSDDVDESQILLSENNRRKEMHLKDIIPIEKEFHSYEISSKQPRTIIRTDLKETYKISELEFIDISEKTNKILSATGIKKSRLFSSPSSQEKKLSTRTNSQKYDKFWQSQRSLDTSYVEDPFVTSPNNKITKLKRISHRSSLVENDLDSLTAPISRDIDTTDEIQSHFCNSHLKLTDVCSDYESVKKENLFSISSGFNQSSNENNFSNMVNRKDESFCDVETFESNSSSILDMHSSICASSSIGIDFEDSYSTSEVSNDEILLSNQIHTENSPTIYINRKTYTHQAQSCFKKSKIPFHVGTKSKSINKHSKLEDDNSIDLNSSISEHDYISKKCRNKRQIHRKTDKSLLPVLKSNMDAYRTNQTDKEKGNNSYRSLKFDTNERFGFKQKEVLHDTDYLSKCNDEMLPEEKVQKNHSKFISKLKKHSKNVFANDKKPLQSEIELQKCNKSALNSYENRRHTNEKYILNDFDLSTKPQNAQKGKYDNLRSLKQNSCIKHIGKLNEESPLMFKKFEDFQENDLNAEYIVCQRCVAMFESLPNDIANQIITSIFGDHLDKSTARDYLLMVFRNSLCDETKIMTNEEFCANRSNPGNLIERSKIDMVSSKVSINKSKASKLSHCTSFLRFNCDKVDKLFDLVCLKLLNNYTQNSTEPKKNILETKKINYKSSKIPIKKVEKDGKNFLNSQKSRSNPEINREGTIYFDKNSQICLSMSPVKSINTDFTSNVSNFPERIQPSKESIIEKNREKRNLDDKIEIVADCKINKENLDLREIKSCRVEVTERNITPKQMKNPKNIINIETQNAKSYIPQKIQENNKKSFASDYEGGMKGVGKQINHQVEPSLIYNRDISFLKAIQKIDNQKGNEKHTDISLQLDRQIRTCDTFTKIKNINEYKTATYVMIFSIFTICGGIVLSFLRRRISKIKEIS